MPQFPPLWPLLKANGRARYRPLGKENYLDEAQSQMSATSTKSSPSTRRYVLEIAPWLFSFFFACSTLWLLVERTHSRPLGSFAAGWATDFISARPAIEVQQVRFNGSPSFHENKTIYIPNPDPVRYIGEPSPLIDENWKKLTWGRYILITEHEAHVTWGDEIDEFWDDEWGGYVAGLDMFHTLHCLDNIRKALHPEYYGPAHNDTNFHLHQDHCIEQLRQYIMCSGDMTPIPTRYYTALGRNYVDSDVPHTCRNFEQLQKWMVGRYEGVEAVQKQLRPGGS